MRSATSEVTVAGVADPAIRARESGFVHDVATVASRALRAIPRDPEAVIPALIVGVFFYAVNVGSLQVVAEKGPVSDFKAFQLPVAIIFSITGVSRAAALVVDIQDGYFDRLLVTPIRRGALLLGLMVADLTLVVCLAMPVVGLGLAVGVRFETGPLGILVFLGFSALWGLAFTGFPYAIALKTGNPAAVNSTFLLFFPFAFLTTSFLPREALTGWLSTMAAYNPVTYLLEAMRSLILEGWDAHKLAVGLLSIAGVGAVSFTLAGLALRSRVRRR